MNAISSAPKDNAMNANLKPCPFCGSNARFNSTIRDRDIWIECKDAACGASSYICSRGEGPDMRPTPAIEDDLASRWNRRVEKAA